MSSSPTSLAQTTDSSSRAELILEAGLVLAWVIVLARLWGGGFTGGDEGFTATAAYNFGGIFAAARAMAEGHGRFYHLIVYPLAQVPYMLDNLAWTNALRIVSSATAITAYWYFVRQLFGRRLALAAGFLLLALQDTVGDPYNPFHALPLWFNVGTALLLCSFGEYVRAVRHGRSTALAYVLYFLSLLSYESVILYLIAFPLIFFWLKPDRPSFSNWQQAGLLFFVRISGSSLPPVSI